MMFVKTSFYFLFRDVAPVEELLLHADLIVNRGCWLSDPLNYKLGRRGTIFFAAMFCLLTVIGSGFAQTWQQLLVCRLLLGIGELWCPA